MKMRIAYIEEPPFYWAVQDGGVIGVTTIEHVPTSFEEFLPRVSQGCWDMNMPIFITPELARRVALSMPV